jgi:hypothetical protein
MRLFAAVAAATLVLGQSIDARAETYTLGIVDGAGCADRQRLIEAVAARVEGVSVLGFGGRWTFFLRYERRFDKVFAELQIRGPDKPPSTRVVDGESCREVTAAVALIMALALDTRTAAAPTAGEAATGAHAASERPPTARTPGAAVDAPARPIHAAPALTATPSQAPPAASVRNAADAGRSTELAIERPAAKARHGSPWRVGVGAELQWTHQFTSNGGMWLLGLRGEGTRAERLFAVIESLLGPRVARDVGNGGSAAFSFYGAGLQLGTRIVGSGSLATDAMLVASLGGLLASSVRQGQVTSSRNATATWMGVGPALRLRWFGDAASLGFQATVPVNLVRPSFIFLGADGSEQAAYQTPSVGIFFGLCGTWNVEPSSPTRRIDEAD